MQRAHVATRTKPGRSGHPPSGPVSGSRTSISIRASASPRAPGFPGSTSSAAAKTSRRSPPPATSSPQPGGALSLDGAAMVTHQIRNQVPDRRTDSPTPSRWIAPWPGCERTRFDSATLRFNAAWSRPNSSTTSGAPRRIARSMQASSARMSLPACLLLGSSPLPRLRSHIGHRPKSRTRYCKSLTRGQLHVPRQQLRSTCSLRVDR